MAYRVVYKKSVHRDLKKLGKKEALQVMNRLERDLSKKPDSCPVLKGKFSGLRRYRTGNYRVIYVILEKDVVILRIGHRKDIYK